MSKEKLAPWQRKGMRRILVATQITFPLSLEGLRELISVDLEPVVLTKFPT